MKSIPFDIQAHYPVSLTDQVYQGFQQAIRSGYYPVGEFLPSLSSMSRQLAVSLIVVRRAVERLAARGLVISRQGRGIEVIDVDAGEWRCQVLHLHWAPSSSWFEGVFSGALQQELRAHRLLLINLYVSTNEVHHDFPRVRDLLNAHPFGLVIVQGPGAGVETILQERRIPFIHLTHGDSLPAARGIIRVCHDRIPAILADHCAATGVRRVGVISGKEAEGPLEASLRRAGIETRLVRVQSPVDRTCAEDFERMALMETDRLLADQPLPDLVFFDDDVIARGGLLAILHRGIRVPDELQVVTWSNRGNGPVFPIPLTRFEFDIGEYAARAADLARDLLDTPCCPPPDIQLHSHFLAGGTTHQGA